MPSPVPLDSRSSRAATFRRPTGNTAVTISAPQRRRPLTSPTTKETASLAQQKTTPLRRSYKNSRLSDRWPVLNRIIRASKTIREQPLSDDSDSSSDSEDDKSLIVYTKNMATDSSSSRYRVRVLHPTSPKFPSPLSGVKLVERLNASRHNYIHHGYSQSALYHQRELWRRRKDVWEDYEHTLWQAGITVEEAYGGMIEDDSGRPYVLPPHLANGPWIRRSPVNSEKIAETTSSPRLVNPAIFPRLGDLSSLRDSFLISVDTWFSDIPLWTLSKLVWIYDVHHRSCSTSPIHRRARRRLSNNFLEDFDASNSSADTLLSSFTDSSDTTLVNIGSGKLPEKSGGAAVVPTCCVTREAPGNVLTQSASLTSNIAAGDRVRAWETCWFSRWEMLYHQVSLAADIAASSGDPDPSTNGSKEAARIILTTPSILYDPHNVPDECDGTVDYEQVATTLNDGLTHSQSTKLRCIEAVEDEEDDYGEVVSMSESKYRLGARLDPLTMFSTATLGYDDTGPNITKYTRDCDRDIRPVTSSMLRNSCDTDLDTVCGLEQLSLCC
ncbi:hypothetical protein EW145_g5433 [Phellinidium pouzarii]|uniref:Uncharacterized protein n=1 Tax=Phellinidium pouzarii TaxID=167371 RepID=A0A4V6S149_9AGAM|nr:hypothetical protein EW145_g5433 [Phellinidium pouzarii]